MKTFIQIFFSFSLISLCSLNYCFAEIEIVNEINPTYGDCNGQIEIQASGDAGPFTISFIGPNEGLNVGNINGNYTFYGLCPGEYSIIVNSNYSCETVIETVLVNCNGFDLGEVIINDVCGNNQGGSIEILGPVTGGNNPYSFNWANGQVGNIINNLITGSYEVTVSDINGCTEFANFIIEENIDPNFAIQINSLGCVCPNGFGLIDISVIGNSGPYEFQWTGDLNSSPTAEDAEVLSVGNYSVVVTNAHGCSVEQDFTVQACDFDINNFNVDITNSCEGPNTGSISIAVNGGAPGPFLFVWETVEGDEVHAGTYNQVSIIENLGPGEYCCSVYTNNNCVTSACGFVVEEYDHSPEFSYTLTPASSNNSGDGAIDLEVTGINGQINYFWQDGPNTQDRTSLNPGAYTVWITYENGNCEEFITIELGTCGTLDNQLQISSEVTPMAGDENNGAINLDITGDEGYNLVFQWTANNNPDFDESTEDISELGAGIYCLEITHPTCPGIILFSECYEICGFGLEIKLENSGGCNTDLMTANVFGNNTPYTYQWSNGNSSPSIYANYEQEYCVTVTDGGGCSNSICEMIVIPEMELSLEVINTTLGTSQGEITANVNNVFFPPLTYEWSNGMTGQTIDGLSVGVYFVTVTDNCGNPIVGQAQVFCEITPNDVDAEIINVSCGNGSAEGAINISVNYDDLGFNTFVWSNGATTEDITNLVAGTYCVEITNYPSGCVYNDCFVVEADGNGEFVIEFETEPGCHGGDDGSLTATVQGGEAPYSFVWYFWDFLEGVEVVGEGETIEGIGSGWYSVLVTDAIGCTDHNYLLFWPSEPTIGFDIQLEDAPVCEGETTDASIINITGGVAPYQYEWRKLYQPIGNESTITDLEPAWYVAVVTDAEGCIREKAFYVLQHPNIEYSTTIISDCNGGSTGSISINPLGNYTYEWSNGHTKSGVLHLNEGTYSVTITDNNGCTASESFQIVNDEINILEEVIQHSICLGACDGSISLEVDASNPISYNWSNGGSTNNIQNLCPGDYNVTITAGGCTYINTYTIEGEAGVFEYEVQVLRHFGTQNIASAKVKIESDLFEIGGSLVLSEFPDMTPVFSANIINEEGYEDISITIGYSNVDPFYFRYTPPNSNCEYFGSFDGIPTCQDEDPNFNFSVEYQGDSEQFCGSLQGHTYHIYRSTFGAQNHPYFLRIYMIDAYDENDSNFDITIEDSGTFPFIVNDIPSGEVGFEYFSLCEPIGDEKHNNCCQGISCEVNSSGYQHDPHDGPYGNYEYFLDYLKLFVRDLCFDPDGGGNEDQSEVVPSFLLIHADENCWYGTVTIDYPGDEPDAVFRVEPNNDSGNYDEVFWITQNNDWDPPASGTYTITVIYDGDDNQGSGTDCEVEIEVDFYGIANHQDAVVFRDDYWLPNIYPQDAIDAYIYAHTCQTCMVEGEYLFDTDDCTSMYNYQFTTFDFVPFDFDNACNGGGVLKVIDFNENGETTIQTIIVPSNISLAEFDYQAFHRPSNEYCFQSGWCHFDGDLVYGTTNEFYKPILATWYNPESCVGADDTSVPPCNDDENPCPFGECENGICVENPVACSPPCPDGFTCDDNGACIANSGTAPCDDGCDCPEGQTCVSGNCLDLPTGEECAQDCQCPDNYECNGDGECELVGCGNCPSETYCTNNNCDPCPAFTITYCYSDDSCGSTTDCAVEIYYSSSEFIVANIWAKNTATGVFFFDDYVGIGSLSPQVRVVSVPNDCEYYSYTFGITHTSEGGGCGTEELTNDEFQCLSSSCLTENDGTTNNYTSNDSPVVANAVTRQVDSTPPDEPILNLLKDEIKTNRGSVYPNPFNQSITVEYNSDKPKVIGIAVSDIYGRTIYQRPFDVNPGLNKTQIDLKNKLPLGVYFVFITDDEGYKESFKLLRVDLEK